MMSGLNHDAPNSNQLQLSTSTSTEPFMYVAHTEHGILLKLDTATGKQVARYHTQLNSDCTVPGCTTNPNGTWMPSRTAVDLDGDVWVANRAFSYQGTITKIANNKGDCIDRNGNGQIETSSDADNDGAVELIPSEFLGQADECIIKSIPVAPPYTYLRALAIDGDGDIWVGTYQSPTAYEVDGNTGAIKRSIPLSSSAYGFVVRGDFLYHASLGQAVERIDISAGANLSGPPGRVVIPSIPNYGIGVDSTGIAWFGDYNSGVRRCTFDAPAGCTHHGGDSHYGVGIDGDGDVWAAAPYSNRVQKYAPSGALLGHTVTGGLQPYGIAIGHDGHPWTAAFNGVAKLDKGAVHGPPGGGHIGYSTAYIPGQAPGVNSPFNYTYSDFTGFQARNVTVKQGTWTVVHDGGTNATPWGRVTWNQEPQGATPAGTLIKAEVRAADNTGDLALLPFVEVSNGAGFSAQNGRYIEVKMTLRIIDVNGDDSPILSDVTIEPANLPPTATCQDVTVGTGPAACTATASINAGSSDPDGDPLTFSQVPQTFGLGTTPATLTVTDPLGLTSSCSANVTVFDDAPPSILCPAPTTIECAGPTTMFTPAAASATDNCSATVTGPGAGPFPLGTSTLAYTASDGTNSASCTSAVTVVDTTAPVITSVTNSFSTIWPPNHNMVALSLTVTATDSCAGGSINTSDGACRITNITSNEAINSTGDGNTDPDWIIGSGLSGSVRAERKGNGTGRIYTITVVCEDAQGNDSAPMTTTVAVPHSNGKM